MVDAPNSDDFVETAANIYVRLVVDGNVFEVPVSEVDRTKEVDVERVREMGLHADAFAINAIDIDGSITFAGSRVRVPNGANKDLDDLLFNEEGEPRVFNVTIAKEDPENPDTEARTETIAQCIVTNSNFSSSTGEATESSYEFVGTRLV